MDLSTVGGLALAVLIVVVTMILDGGSPVELFAMPQAILLTLGGSFVASAITVPLDVILRIPKFLQHSFFNKKVELAETVDLIVRMADKARREGLLALEDESKKIDDSFLRKGIMLVVDGVEPEQVRAIMELEIKSMEERHEAGINFFNAAGGFSPTFGIIGTVMGLINVLQQLSDAEKLTKAIAGAFLATLWGLLSANLIWIPIAGKLTTRSQEEAAYRHMLLEGIVALQAGENPRLLREKLNAFMPPAQRQTDEGRKSGASA